MSEKFYKEAWEYTLNELHNEYKEQDKETEFILYFNIKYEEDTIDTITVSVPSTFMMHQVTKNNSIEIIKERIRKVTGQNNINLNLVVKSEQVQKPAESNNPSEKNNENLQAENNKSEIKTTEKKDISENKNLQKKKHPQLREELTFENFIPGDNSMFAYNAAISVAKNPGKEKNPILFYGGSGLGKTHLMQAIGNFIYNENPKLKICYISAENFTNEFTDSIRTKKTSEFKNKYRNLDVLLLDDIHFLQGKESTQEELFYTFNALYDMKSQMVFTCDRPIREIKNMTDRLVSRLSNGLCIDLQPPNFETRYAILQKKVENKGKYLDPEILEYVAKNVETNVRELESALLKIFGYEELIGEKLTLDIVKTQLRDIIKQNSSENISLDVIQKVIADNYQISVQELKGKRRDKKFVIPRQIAIYIAREITEISYTELGNEFGGKDHSTVMHAYEKIADQIKTDPSLDSRIQLLIREVKDFKK